MGIRREHIGPERPRLIAGDSAIWVQTDHFAGYTARRATVLDFRPNQRVRVLTVDDEKPHTVKTNNLYTESEYRAAFRTATLPT